MASSKNPSLSERLINVLTETEMGALVDAFFAVVSLEKQEEAIAQLSDDTQKTIRAVLTISTQSSKQKGKKAKSKAPIEDKPTPSLAKQQQTWSGLWKEWDAIVFAAGEEDGKYIEQEASWEPPYFDEYQYMKDLEQVATQLKPLILIALDHTFTPYQSFIEAVEEAVTEVERFIPDWMSPIESFSLEPELTFCVLQWEWLTIRGEGRSAFEVVQQIRDYQREWKKIYLSDHIVLDFFTQISDADKQTIFDGLTAQKNTPEWQYELNSPRSPWHTLYLDLVEKYSPNSYQETLRVTIPQKWSNGLPIIESLLEQSNMSEAQAVLEETLKSWLSSHQGPREWEPETCLLIANASVFNSNYDGILSLLGHYKTIAQSSKQSDRVAALEIQLAVLSHCFDWQKIFVVFTNSPLPGSTQTPLFTTWCNYIVKHALPYGYPNWATSRYSYGYSRRKTIEEPWWVIWLLEAIETDLEANPNLDPNADLDADQNALLKGRKTFQKNLLQWLTSLPGELQPLGENIAYLTLLTSDLGAIAPKSPASIPNQYPLFCKLVIPATQEMHKQNAESRQRYLKCYMPEDLSERVMMYWKSNFVNFVPNPANAAGSDYTVHAQWMAVLQELVPPIYSSLLAQWKQDHKRRRNLWKAMQQQGLGGL
ncbi:MAG: hypothetical protein AAGD25_21250 [Cyanobacteria bacterium P01_F01_bin.150]